MIVQEILCRLVIKGYCQILSSYYAKFAKLVKHPTNSRCRRKGESDNVVMKNGALVAALNGFTSVVLPILYIIFNVLYFTVPHLLV